MVSPGCNELKHCPTDSCISIYLLQWSWHSSIYLLQWSWHPSAQGNRRIPGFFNSLCEAHWVCLCSAVLTTGLTHAKLLSLTSLCCRGWPAPMNTSQGQQRTAEQRWVRWFQCLIRKRSCVNHQFQFHTQMAYKHDIWSMLLVTVYYWHSHKIQSHQFSDPFFRTLARPFHLSQWLLHHILVICSPHVNKCWVTRAIYGIRCGWNHWPITIQHVRAQWGSIVSWRACSTGSEKAAGVSRSIGNFSNGF